jgi:hypothetical protein
VSLHLPSRRRALLAAAAALTLLGVGAPSSRAGSNPDNYDCRGHVEAGAPAPGDEDPQVKYLFGCSGPITGYQIQADQPIGSFDTAPIALDGNGAAVTSDSFTCNGDIPGLAVNCVGVYGGVFVNNRYETVVGQFSISGNICDEPRVDPLLTVVYATGDRTGKVTQHIAGPYDLGRPHGCKPSARSGKTRIPKDGLTLGGEPVKQKKAVAKKKAHAKKKAKSTRS